MLKHVKYAMTGIVRHLRLAFLLAAALGVTGCRSLSRLGGKAALPPFPSEKLLDGDVLVTRSPSLLSPVYAWHPRYHGPYSHAALFYRRPGDGTPMLLQISGPLSVVPLEKALPSFARIRVLRDRHVQPEHNPLKEYVRQYHSAEYREQVPSLFDPANRKEGSSRLGFTCVGFANEVYKEAGLAPPFAPGLPDPVVDFLQWYDGEPGHPPVRRTSPNSALYMPDLITVATWRNPRVSDAYLDELDEITRDIAEQLRVGYVFRPPPLGSRAWFGLLASVKGLNRVERQLGPLRIQYLRLVRRVRSEISQCDLHGTPLSTDPGERQKQIRHIFHEVATAYMVLPEPPVPRTFE